LFHGCHDALVHGQYNSCDNGKQKLYNNEVYEEVRTPLNEKGHCLAATLLSVAILSLSGKPKLLEQNSSRINFSKISLAIHAPFWL
jgi:hypothetical protein